MLIPEPMFLRACELYVEGDEDCKVCTKEDGHDGVSGVYFYGRSGALHCSNDSNRYLKERLVEFLEGKQDPVIALAVGVSITLRCAAQAYLEASR